MMLIPLLIWLAVTFTFPTTIWKPLITVPYVASEIEQHHVGPGEAQHGGAGVQP